MKLANSPIRTEQGNDMRRVIAFLRTRLAFKSIDAVDTANQTPDQLDLTINNVPVSLIAVDDVVGCGGIVVCMSAVKFEEAKPLLEMNPMLLAVHDASFAWFQGYDGLVLTRRIPDIALRDEDDLFDFATQTVSLLNNCEQAMTVASKEQQHAMSSDVEQTHLGGDMIEGERFGSSTSGKLF